MIVSTQKFTRWSVDYLQTVSDTELVKRAQSQRTDIVAGAQAAGVEAVGELYDRHHERIFRYIWSRVSNKQLAEDLTGDVFTRMVVNLPKYRPSKAPFRAWLFRIAHNLVIDHYRKVSGGREVSLEQVGDLDDGEGDLAESVAGQMEFEGVWAAMKTLKPIEQEVITLRFMLGLSLREVAMALDKTVGAVKVTQYRGLKELRTVLESEVSEGRDE
jgi:RNA polymerase sigma-70 factor (ECF subfamily)